MESQILLDAVGVAGDDYIIYAAGDDDIRAALRHHAAARIANKTDLDAA
jgi:hypothetical protein